MIIMKFGGSSLANAERIRHVVDIIKMHIDEKPLVVASAMGDTTDNLLEAVDRALAGKICIKDIRKLHLATAEELEVNPDVLKDLFEELKNLLGKSSGLSGLFRRMLWPSLQYSLLCALLDRSPRLNSRSRPFCASWK